MDCSQRQGSQGFEVEYSQSPVGQARTQFIPPPPSAGQRNQHQSQGTTQAPSVTQAGQRGQSARQGQGHGSQAETSSKTGQTICYYYHQLRHMRRDFPRR